MEWKIAEGILLAFGIIALGIVGGSVMFRAISKHPSIGIAIIVGGLVMLLIAIAPPILVVAHVLLVESPFGVLIFGGLLLFGIFSLPFWLVSLFIEARRNERRRQAGYLVVGNDLFVWLRKLRNR